MNIKKVRKPAYEAQCDGCQRPGPLMFTPQGAEVVAKEEGWQVLSRHNGLVWIEETLCPDCYAERQTEKGETDVH